VLVGWSGDVTDQALLAVLDGNPAVGEVQGRHVVADEGIPAADWSYLDLFLATPLRCPVWIGHLHMDRFRTDCERHRRARNGDHVAERFEGQLQTD
jgi:hypothetical protein